MAADHDTGARVTPEAIEHADDGRDETELAADDDLHADEDDDDVVVLSWWQHPANVIAIVVAVALIGGMIGWLIGDDRQAARGGDVDVGFLHDMRAHHEQAVQMAYIFQGLEDTSPGLQTVAGSILIGQNMEIGRMIQMLRDMGRPEAAETEEAMAWMGTPMDVAEMPGMATDEQLAELAESSGAAADELFVELMVDHHEGGIHMAEVAAEDAELAKVRSLANSIMEGQRGEIAELQGLLE
jgi:uncharacterized protein (DUF305 family)